MWSLPPPGSLGAIKRPLFRFVAEYFYIGESHWNLNGFALFKSLQTHELMNILSCLFVWVSFSVTSHLTF